MKSERIINLENAYRSFCMRETFSPGDIVTWKKGMANKMIEGPFIVVDVLDKPIIDHTEDPSSSYFREPLDILVGFFNDEKNFFLVHLDSRRLMVLE